ncbi:MAG: prolyl oligopeptidase family serine peptidase [Gammaproteobacteria bacterium]|nr:prolyl oligopeptidase family serine peptidase [Gammaproteobacteria bacterium]MBT3860730.1 prolyl oligopeptidase family serine peptidase [Gammaproteobacteria bacterium]MBT3985924.1 prolyl oligopeptidase family serine peptidase [Gammaproteobacteria bacterium]MBT4580863.1 prolyl oligopeptidase family serine peptidase [Gammaproteobacteria bacterium]MBT4659369.1 prolyl oligopeptidase family serine peptidase [Gammaproteobacteria bacterium]
MSLASCQPESSDQVATSSGPATASSSRLVDTVTLADYQRAETFLSANTGKLVLNNILAQNWQNDNRLIYKRSVEGGSEYLIADAVAGSKSVLLDTVRLASQLAAYSEEEIDGNDLPLSRLQFKNDELEFVYSGDIYSLNLQNYRLIQLSVVPRNEYLSPDESKAAYIDSHNLWLRDTSTNELTQLTFDGEENYGYATNNAGWIRSDGPVLAWSPDSSRIATFRHDGRNVEDMYLYSTRVGHPELDQWKYPLVGDEYIFMIERVVIHLEAEPRLVKLDMPPDAHRSTTSDHVSSFAGRFLDVQWSEDGSVLSFVSSSRDHKSALLRIADPESGEVRDVLEEVVETHYEAGPNAQENWRVLDTSDEFIWFSEKDNWGHLYLHDLQSGQLKNQITSGNWNVRSIQKLDLENEQVYFIGTNREEGDPYFQYLYRINLDGSGLINLTPEPANHGISWPESREYFSDIYSTPTQAPVSLIRNLQGEELLALEETDIEPLLASGWVAPEPFRVKARDQITDIYGLMYKPTNFDSSRSYPVLNYLYPGPQAGSVGSRSFRASRNDKQSLAELGFIVIELDAMGTPGRSKSFHDAFYGDMGDNGLPDQIAGIRQLAVLNPWMDLDRVGIWGHSGGGFASTGGILRYPDFYKVAVSGAGNHDNRNYEDDWGERYQGLLETFDETNPLDEAAGEAAAASNYDSQANQLLAENLQGKLLLGHGMLDTNVHPTSTLLLVDALIEADKDFDLVILPNSGHGFGNRRYFMKRRWDYFVEHLIGQKPVSGFNFADNIR